ncbi:MAG: cell division protein FtsW [Bacteroidetes bacterium HGW-Bacteroidetes-8]|jgi:cell division protein FtsW|nr:MAG: cell division protein FtsW [Bacteroidetes bacterium HGW-Bacteroidetes-8]
MEAKESIIHRLKGDKAIWIIVFMLSMISIAAVYSSSSALAFKENRSTIDFLFKQMRFVVFGLTALYICYKIPLGWYRMLSYFGIIISIGLLAATLFFGNKYNDAERWLRIFGISFQPAEIAKIAVILYLSKVLERFTFENFKEFFWWVVSPVSVVVLLILYGSISTAILLSAVAFLMFIIAGIKWSHLIKTAGIAFGVLVLVVLLNLAFGIFPRVETAFNRIKNFTTEQEIHDNLSPAEKQRLMDKTFQADMAKIAVASVGVFGKGPGNSTQRNLLPHPYSDFIYAIIIEEWGFLGGLVVLMLYVWFFTRCIMLSKSCTTTFSSMMVIGLSILITSQALLHICVNVGLLPVTGHTLPLISLGGTSLIIMSGAFGMILSVSRTIENVKSKEDAPLNEVNNESDNPKGVL